MRSAIVAMERFAYCFHNPNHAAALLCALLPLEGEGADPSGSMCIMLLVLFVPLLVICAVTIIRRLCFFGRKKLKKEEVRVLFGMGDAADGGLEFLSRCYCVPVGFLRPNDTFTSEGKLWKYDSWLLNIGQDRVNEYIKLNCRAKIDMEFWTLKDFVAWYSTLK